MRDGIPYSGSRPDVTLFSTAAMPLGRMPASFDHPDWIFQIKYDGFRALAFIDGDCRLVSRKGNVYKSFPILTADLARAVPGPGHPGRRDREP